MAGNASVHQSFWEYLKAALEAIETDSGYWTNPAVMEFEPPEPDQDGGPWVVMGFGDESVDEYSCGRRYNMAWSATIDCYTVKTASNTARDLFRLMQDVRRAIEAFAASMVSVVGSAHVTNGDAAMHEGTLNHVAGHAGARIVVDIKYSTKDAW